MAKTKKNIMGSVNKQARAVEEVQLEQQKNLDENEKKNDDINNDVNDIERNKYVFELVNMWISNADNKINIAFAMLSAVVAVVVFITDSLLSDIPVSQNARPCMLNIFYCLAIFAGVCFCLSILFYLLSVIPRLTSDKSIKDKLKKNKEEKKAKYSIFYDEIKDFEKAEHYVEAAKAADLEVFNEELLKEIYYNSDICSKKMHWFRCGGVASFATIILSLIAALFYFLYAVGV